MFVGLRIETCRLFNELVFNKKIDIGYLTTHTFKLDDAPKAFDMILSRSEPFIGILIEYDVEKPLKTGRIRVSPEVRSQKSEVVNIGFIGAGSYAQSHLLPNIPKNNNVLLNGVMTTTGTGSRSVAERYGFDFCTTSENDIIENDDINTVFIATRHDSHAHYVLKALKTGKHVFVEKPLCLSEEELGQIVELLNSQIGEHESDLASSLQPPASSPLLMVGYNRRFAPLIRKIKDEFGHGPMAMVYRVNAGAIPKDSWIQDPEFGGGRVVGEVCHFVDTLSFLAGSMVVSVYAAALREPDNLNDTLNVTLTFQNGSIGTISYLANGDKSLAKERIEVFAHGATAIVDDFKELMIYSRGKKKKKKLISQDKGQKEEVKRFVEAILNGTGEPIPFEEIYNTSLVTFKIIESIRTGTCVKI